MASHFIAGLKNRSEEVRLKYAQELQQYVSTELREVPSEETQSFADELNHNIFELVSSNEVHEKRGGVLAISKFLTLSYCLYCPYSGLIFFVVSYVLCFLYCLLL